MQKTFLLTIIFFVLVFNQISAQSVSSKVSFPATDGKTYTGVITEVQGDKYKVKYDGFDFESWLTANQFTVTDAGGGNTPSLPVSQDIQQPVNTNTQPANTTQQQPLVVDPNQNTSGTSAKQMTAMDSIKMNLAIAKDAFNKIFVTKRETLVLTVSNVDYDNPGVSILKENLKKIKAVKTVNSKYADGNILLEVGFKGKANEVWDNLSAETKALFKVVNISDNAITVKTK